jgi:hypothetical protein
MKDTDIIEDKFGEIELKLLRTKVIKEVEKILEQVSNKDEDFLYPDIDINSPSGRAIAMNPLIKGEFMGHLYEICTNGAHPTAYVNCGEDSFSNKESFDGLPVHGGCTFFGTRYIVEGFWVGWDYGHYCDYITPLGAIKDGLINFGFPRRGKKWTVAEVMQDVIKAILYIEENK